MQLLEVYVQGVNRFLTSHKFSLKSGYNVVYGGNETGKSALAQALIATFDSEAAALAAARLQPLMPQEGTPRYGVLFEHEGVTYRLLRGIPTGLNLARLDPEQRKFELLVRDEGELRNFFDDVLDFPMPGFYRLLGLLDRHLLSGGEPTNATTAGLTTDAFSFADEAEDDSDQGLDLDAQIRQLERERNVLASVGDLEYRLDGVQAKKFETESNLSKHKDYRVEQERIVGRLEKLKPLEEASPTVLARIQNLDQQEQMQKQKLNALDADIAEIEGELDALEPQMQRRFHKDPFFLGGAAAALIGFGLPFITKPHFLALVGFGALGWLGYLLFVVYPKIVSAHAGLNKRYKEKCAEEERVKREFDEQNRQIQELVKELQAIDAKDLIKLNEELAHLKTKRGKHDESWKEFSEAVGDEAKLKADFERQEAEVALFEEELRNAGAITRDIHQIEQELARLTAVRDGGVAPVAVQKVVASAAHTASASAGSAMVRILEVGAETSRRSEQEFAQLVGEKFNLYLNAISPGRFHPVELQAGSEPLLRRADFGGAETTIEGLGDGARIAVGFAFRAAVLEVVLTTRNFPVIVDDPFGALDEKRRAVAGKILKRLAGFAQVVHLTPSKAFVPLADHHVELPA